MPLGLVVFRRDLPGGRIVTVSLDQRSEREVIGRLQIERRAEPERRTGEPPIVAEVRGATREAVMAELRRIAESDAELSQRLDQWQQAHRATAQARAEQVTPPTAADRIPDSTPTNELPVARRLQMPDGEWWSAERRHEMAKLHSGRRPVPLRRVYVFFAGPRGALRRTEVPQDFPTVWEAEAGELVSLWAGAEILAL